MSNSSKPRVVRKHNPRKQFTRFNYRSAQPLLLEDFQERCAYSLMHVRSMGDMLMHVDHHDPRKKNRSPYSNLFPAYCLCNSAKRDTWPCATERRAGRRFLNPCTETDYGEQIFEDPTTHELIGTTTAAHYHIDVIDLNNPSLVLHRKERAELAKYIWIGKKNDSEGARILFAFAEILNYKIPPIPSPPSNLACPTT